jgi:hypothetical protein
MVKVDSGFVINSDGKVKCSLIADSRDDIKPGMVIKGLPTEYQDKLDFGTTVFTAGQELGMLKSDGTWDWGD